MSGKLDSNSSFAWPPAPSPTGGQHHPYLGGNVSYVDFYLHQPSVAAVFIISYLLIFLLCMLGNGVVCFLVLRSRQMRTVTNLFIFNLAVSDLLVGIFCMPTTLLDNIIAGWPFGSLVCKLSGMVQGISVSASVFTLVAIAVDRFRCIVHPFKRKPSAAAAAATIALIWLLAVAIMCPSAVMLQIQEEKRFRVVLGRGNQTLPVYWCREAWPEPGMRRVYTAVLFANIYLAPLSLILLMYARISVALSSPALPVPGEPGRRRRLGGGRKKQKVIKMLMVVAALFTLSWLPLWTLMLLSDYAELSALQLQVINVYLYPLAHWLAFFNSSINPIVYGFFNENFRRGFRAAFGLRLRRGRPPPGEGCGQPAPAAPPAAEGQAAREQACQRAEEERKRVKKGNWVNDQQEMAMEDLGEPCADGIE
ncbi:neuropeptide FF receptor 2 [Dryobates pubescens]|uniref:neuropeptide FF receptor 2 n=1 Tax=Dryobates pubescens TaxID=118200 RepID=UPI0023BA2274|nr:neuropeptide FF receptor 2 [Dryobates pubescens]